MIKIESAEKIEKKQRRNRMIVGFILIFLMLFSTIGYAFYSSDYSSPKEPEKTDDGFQQGQYVDGFWTYQVNGEQFYFLSYIDLARKTEISLASGLENYYGKPLFVVSDDPIVESEIARNLGRYTSRVQKACYKQCEDDLPEKTCEDNLIIYKESENNKVYQSENCVFIEGNLASVDSFLYKLLGFT